MKEGNRFLITNTSLLLMVVAFATLFSSAGLALVQYQQSAISNQ